MARLPSERFLIQQIGEEVVLFEGGTEQEIVKFNPANADEVRKAQHTIYLSNDLSDEDKCFAHFWSGYFHAHAQ